MTCTDNARAVLLEQCRDLAHSPSILDILEKEIRKQGFSGSADIPKLVYLAFLTGMLNKPVSLVIKGPSGAGKSFSLRAGQQFIPETAYEQFEGMSEKALVYLEGLNLKHKHLVIGEASGMADGNGRTLLRQLLSEGKVRYATVQSTSEGLKGSELPTLEGPAGLIMTTTATGLHPEDESRMISVSIKESPEQIADALMAQALGLQRQPEPLDTAPWFALYDYVHSGPKTAVVPYAPRIAAKLPRTHHRVQRDFPQVLSLIQASALLHSCNRGLDNRGRVMASWDDYETVRSLVNDPISQGLEKAVPDGIRQVVEGVQTVQQQSHYGHSSVSQIKLAEHLQRDPSVVSRNVKKALEQGYLQNDNPGQGREAELRIGQRKLPSELVLPAPEEIFGQPELHTPLTPAELATVTD